MTSKREQALQLNQLHERSLDKLQKQQRMLQQAKQDEAAERCRAGMAAAAKEAAAKEVAAKEAAREAAANANKGSQPAVVQPLSSTAQTPAVAVDLAGVAEKGQQDIDVQVCQPVSKAEKARLQREMAHRRKAKAKEVKAAARAAEDAAEHAANEYIAEQAAATEAAEVDQHDDSQQVEEAAVVEDDAVEDVVDPKVDVDPQQVNDAESVEDKVSEEVVVEDAPHTPSVAQSEGPAAGLLAGDAPMPHAVNTRVADDSQQKEDAEALEDVVHEGIVVDGPHSPSVASSEGLSGLHHVADDEAVPYAVMAAGSVFVAGTLVMGAWCAAFTSPVWVPRVGIRCMRAAWSSWALKKNSN